MNVDNLSHVLSEDNGSSDDDCDGDEDSGQGDEDYIRQSAALKMHFML